jgi:hypothetical protein
VWHITEADRYYHYVKDNVDRSASLAEGSPICTRSAR